MENFAVFLTEVHEMDKVEHVYICPEHISTIVDHPLHDGCLVRMIGDTTEGIHVKENIIAIDSRLTQYYEAKEAKGNK
jgi:hypothetical protein